MHRSSVIYLEKEGRYFTLQHRRRLRIAVNLLLRFFIINPMQEAFARCQFEAEVLGNRLPDVRK